MPSFLFSPSLLFLSSLCLCVSVVPSLLFSGGMFAQDDLGGEARLRRTSRSLSAWAAFCKPTATRASRSTPGLGPRPRAPTGWCRRAAPATSAGTARTSRLRPRRMLASARACGAGSFSAARSMLLVSADTPRTVGAGAGAGTDSGGGGGGGAGATAAAPRHDRHGHTDHHGGRRDNDRRRIVIWVGIAVVAVRTIVRAVAVAGYADADADADANTGLRRRRHCRQGQAGKKETLDVHEISSEVPFRSRGSGVASPRWAVNGRRSTNPSDAQAKTASEERSALRSSA